MRFILLPNKAKTQTAKAAKQNTQAIAWVFSFAEIFTPHGTICAALRNYELCVSGGAKRCKRRPWALFLNYIVFCSLVGAAAKRLLNQIGNGGKHLGKPLRFCRRFVQVVGKVVESCRKIARRQSAPAFPAKLLQTLSIPPAFAYVRLFAL